MKIEGYKVVPVHHQTGSPCMRPPRKQTITRKTHNNFVWVPAIPSWEKEFCYKIGLFKWNNFLEAKKLTSYAHKILEWNDSAAEEAFNTAKKRFFAQINGLPFNQSLPNPDLYIDEIVWDDGDKVINSGALEFARSESSDDDNEDQLHVHGIGRDYVPNYYDIPIEDIKPTGWDVDVEEFSQGKVLTGRIIGS